MISMWKVKMTNSQNQRIECCCSVPQPCLTLCDPVECIMPGLPIPHHLLKSFPQFVMTHIVKGIVNETEVDVFLEFSCFFCDPANVGNWISGSSSFSKPSLDIWKFLVALMLKPSMQDVNHYLRAWEMNAIVRW